MKRNEDGTITWTPDEEASIEASAEARRRANRYIAEDNRKAKEEEGMEDDPDNPGKKRKKSEPKPAKKGGAIF